MSDKILYIALVVSVLGLLVLAYVSAILVPPVSSISGIGTNSIGKQVHVRGSVSDYKRFSGGSAILTLDDGSGSISVYLQYSVSKALPDAANAKSIDVVGEVDEYKGSLEVVPKNPESFKILS